MNSKLYASVSISDLAGLERTFTPAHTEDGALVAQYRSPAGSAWQYYGTVAHLRAGAAHLLNLADALELEAEAIAAGEMPVQP